MPERCPRRHAPPLSARQRRGSGGGGATCLPARPPGGHLFIFSLARSVVAIRPPRVHPHPAARRGVKLATSPSPGPSATSRVRGERTTPHPRGRRPAACWPDSRPLRGCDGRFRSVRRACCVYPYQQEEQRGRSASQCARDTRPPSPAGCTAGGGLPGPAAPSPAGVCAAHPPLRPAAPAAPATPGAPDPASHSYQLPLTVG